MKKFLYTAAIALSAGVLATGCIEEIEPQSSTVTVQQAGDAPNSFQNFVNAVSVITGQFFYSPSDHRPNDFGISAYFLARDVMGQDIALNYDGSWFSAWYVCSVGLGPGYAYCQMPWSMFYGFIKNANTVVAMGGSNPDDTKKEGVGVALAFRAYFYMNLAQMYNAETYAVNPEALTVPWVDENTIVSSGNPRVTNEVIWGHIMDDLDKAEEYLAGYERTDKTLPDINVVYGLKARAYHYMGKWAEAESYAKKAMNGYTMLTESQFLDFNTGFNTDANSSWMWSTKFKSDDPCILENDADSSWGSIMNMEIFHQNGKGCGYASNYGSQLCIDKHLYSTIPATDWRKRCWLDFDIDEMSTADALNALSAYTEYPVEVYTTPHSNDQAGLGGISMKFRPAGGYEGRMNQYIGFCVDVPLMRVEEMKLIEAEAAGMQDESRGIQLLTAFGLTRDPSYVYGTHNESYYNNNTSKFQNEVWWQRRVELWGEGFATYDIKRLNKGIIRSYAGTNHLEQYRWNSQTPPQWMIFCIGGTDATYNDAIVQNPTPVAPTSDSPEYAW